MNMSTTNSKHYVNFSGKMIQTTITDKAEIVESWIRQIRAIHAKPFLVGLGCKWKRPKNEVAILQLCIENKCLVIQLLHMDRIPRLLKGFFHDSSITFAGVKVEKNARKLREDYGLKCFTVMDVQKLPLEQSKKVTMSNWEAGVLKEDQVQYACIDAYVCYITGRTLLLCRQWRINNAMKTFDKIKMVCWLPPDHGVIKANCDGASRGNPGYGGAGISFRGRHTVKGLFAKGLGMATNYEAETEALVIAMEVAVKKNWKKLWLESDSLSAVQAFQQEKVPWFLKARWNNARRKFQSLKVSHIYREANFSADKLSKYGSSLQKGVAVWWDTPPDFLTVMEMPNKLYYRKAK